MTVDTPLVHEQIEHIINDLTVRTDESLSSLQKAISMLQANDKQNGEYEGTLASILVDKGRDLKLVDRLDDEAYRIFEAVLLIDPNNGDAHYHQAWLDYFKEDTNGAISHFESALSQKNLSNTLRIRALCKLALLYASFDDLKLADVKVKEAANLLSSANLEQDRELATLVDMTVFITEQAHTVASRLAELEKPAPYLGIDIDGEYVFTAEKVDEWFESVDKGYVLLDFRNTKAHLNVKKDVVERDAIELNEKESMIIDMLMREKKGLSVRRFLESVWDEEHVQPSVVKTCINRLRNKLSEVFEDPSNVIRTIGGGYV